MIRFFTYYLPLHAALEMPAGRPIARPDGWAFGPVRAQPGDEVYLVSVGRGRLLLVGKVRVGKVRIDNFIADLVTDARVTKIPPMSRKSFSL
jgi:hypothetical protein